MALREIIEIDEALCDGCGACTTGCPEGALRLIEGKARLVGESLCDGLGACIGTCPRGAITVTRREAEDYDEARVIAGISRHGPATTAAHLDHLAAHGQELFLGQALAWLAQRGIPDPRSVPAASSSGEPAEGACGCPGSAARRFRAAEASGAARPGSLSATPVAAGVRPSALGAWPIQLHLVNPRAPQFAGAELLLAADCTAFALGSFHAELLAGRSLAIACPKLDTGRESYLDKLALIIGAAASVTVAIMEVPCCAGLLKLAQEARGRLGPSGADKALRCLVVGVEGGIKAERVY